MAKEMTLEQIINGLEHYSLKTYTLFQAIKMLKHQDAEIKRINEIISNLSKGVPKQGKWIGSQGTGQYDDWYCSICGKYEGGTRNRDRLGSYCSHCGGSLSIDKEIDTHDN